MMPSSAHTRTWSLLLLMVGMCSCAQAQVVEDFEIRNRWGALVWSTTDANQPWLGQVADGSHFVPDGVYHWKVTYRDQLGFPKVKQGTLTLFR